VIGEVLARRVRWRTVSSDRRPYRRKSSARAELSHAHSPDVLAIIGAVVVVAGLFVPLWLLALGAPRQMVAAVRFILLGAIVVRSEIVRLPHLLRAAIGSGRRT
jgi:hypothetical protein